MSLETAEAPEAAWAHSWLKDRHVLVSGGTGGIGLGLARSFASAGARVIATGATPEDVARAVEAAPEIAFAPLDVRSTEEVRQFVGAQEALDVVINCAGIIRRGAERDPEVFAQVIDINLTGSMRICEAALPLLAASGGSILNIASMLSFFGGGLVPGYAASKGGVAQMTKSLAIAYAPQGVRVNAIAPGWIATPLTQALQDDPARATPILARTPLGRWGRPQDLGGIALFLCSPHAGFITGTVIPVDGGYSIC